ncbi:MAG: type II toxin-antitoxin system RelE/ParE family toxin [Treponema sp.]|jgi:plasmid stabilization system protein ParE|nr:type II toxin-antitoxin system RelE/ParE family toxin [Treponema sp.]
MSKTPKYHIEFTSSALRHIDKIAEYHLERVGPISAEKITDKLLDGFQILETFPYSGSEHPDEALAKQGYRKIVIGQYVGVYRIIEKIVYVYGIFHGAIQYQALFK